MTDFKREHDRYIVVKVKDLPGMHAVKLREYIRRKGLEEHLVECVVVEPDWPIYEETWENVQRLAEGKPSIGEERDAARAAKTKAEESELAAAQELDEAKAERDALMEKVGSLENAIARQSVAAKQGMDAAKQVGAHMEAEARRLHAECNPGALESERAANAQLTEELEQVMAERDALAAHMERLTRTAATIRGYTLPHTGRCLRMIMEVVEGNPTTSLSRLIAEKQAEALERAIRVMGQQIPEGAWVCFAEDLQEMVNDYRRQAEER